MKVDQLEARFDAANEEREQQKQSDQICVRKHLQSHNRHVKDDRTMCVCQQLATLLNCRPDFSFKNNLTHLFSLFKLFTVFCFCFYAVRNVICLRVLGLKIIDIIE